MCLYITLVYEQPDVRINGNDAFLQQLIINRLSIPKNHLSVTNFSLKRYQITLKRLSFPDFSRRFSVSLTTFVDTFIESSLKVFTLPSFPS